jgi:hypothetical protein
VNPSRKSLLNSPKDAEDAAQINSSQKSKAQLEHQESKGGLDSRSTQMMFDHNVKKRRKSTMPEKVQLPKINDSHRNPDSRNEKRMASVDEG